MVWRSSPTTTWIGGAPIRPLSFTSQPTRSSTAWRAAASAVTCAIWQPVTKPNETPSGRPSSSAVQAPAISSTTAADGPPTYSPAFWSQAEVSQSAASAAGTAPPITKPK